MAGGSLASAEDRVLLRVLVPQPFRPERPSLTPRWRFVRGRRAPARRGLVWRQLILGPLAALRLRRDRYGERRFSRLDDGG